MNIPEPRPGLVPDDATLDAVAAELGRSRAWVDTLYTLPVPEFRRALRASPPVLARRPGEEMYPTTGWLGDYLLYCQEMEAPLAWHFWCGVSLLGVAARRNLYVDRNRYMLFLNQFVLILGPSGLTKSTTLAQCDDVFRAMQAHASGGAGLEPVYRSPDRITSQKLLEDVTKWTKVADSRKDTILYLVNDELATMLGKDVKGADTLADFITAMYMRGHYHDSTVSGKERLLINGSINCLFATTPASMRRNMSENLFAEGFMGRTITVSRSYEDRHGMYPTPPPADPVMCRQLGHALVPWVIMDRSVEVRPDDAAREWMDTEWYPAHHRSSPADEKITAFWQRKQDHIYKLAGILALSEAIPKGPDLLGDTLWVDLPTMRLALRLLEIEEARLPAAFNMIGARDEAQDIAKLQLYIEKWWAKHGEPAEHSRILQNCRHYIKDAQHFRHMLDTLVSAELIQLVPMGHKQFYKPRSTP